MAKLFIEIDPDSEYLQIGEAKVKLVSRRRRGRGKTRYQIEAPKSVEIKKHREPTTTKELTS